MIETVKENLCINRIIGSKNFNLTIEGDVVIPDTKPDILSAVNMTGNVCIYKKEILEGKIRLDGNVNIYLMYMADSQNSRIRGFNTSIDFTEILDFPGIQPNMILDEEIVIKNIECKVLNGRKVNLKVMLDVKADVFSNEKEELVKEINNIEDIQAQITLLKLNSLVGQNMSKALAKETLIIDDTDMLEEILNVDFNIINKDTKISYNKILAKADIEIRILYLTEEGRIKSIEETIPVMGFIDIAGVAEDNICDVSYKLKNVLIKPNNKEEHSINVEIEFEISARAFERKEISIIQDMYSPSRNLEFKENKINTIVNMRNTDDTINIKEKLKLDDSEYRKICDVQVKPLINDTSILKDRAIIDGDIEVNFLLTNSIEDNIITLNKKIPFNYTQEIEGLKENSKMNTSIVPKFREFITDDTEITAKIDLELNTNSYNLETVNVIDDIEETEDGEEHPYSMVIYFVKPGDTLWKIAKKYKSTVNDIARINELENPDKINVGMQLFIPKCSTCRTEIKI